jgi:hypothetical protein
MRGRFNLLRIIECGLTGAGLLLAGAGALPVGGALGPAALSSTTPAALPPSVGVVIIPGPSLAGEATKLTLQLSVTDVAHPTPLSVTDLLPSGLRYVPGSSRLVTATRSVPATSVPLGRPRASTTSRGTLMVWSTVRVSPGVGVESWVFEVAPAAATGKPGAPDLDAAGRSWTDQATVREARAGRVALGATNRATIEVVPVSAVQIGHLLAPTKPGPERLQESLTVSSTREGPADDVIIRLYLPGRVTWAGCVPGRWCTRPVVGELRLPVMTAQPDRPRLPPLSAGTPSVTVTHPAVTHPAVVAVAKPIPMARFTVLTWCLGTLPAGTSRTLTYRLDASPLAQPRTEDLVTATASLTTASVVTPAASTAATAPPTTPPPTTTMTPATSTPSTTTPTTTTPTTTTPTTTTPTTTTHATASVGPSSITPGAGEAAPSAAVVTHESAAIRASALQAWPGSAAIAPVAVNGADATTTTTNVIDPFGSASTTTTSPSSTSTTSKTRAGTSTTTTTSASTSTTTSSTSPTTVPKAGLATTGADAVLGLIGAGGLVLLSSFIRRRRRPTPDDPSGTTPTGDR